MSANPSHVRIAKRVVIFSDFAPGYGITGNSAYLASVANYLAGRGQNVEVAVLRWFPHWARRSPGLDPRVAVRWYECGTAESIARYGHHAMVSLINRRVRLSGPKTLAERLGAMFRLTRGHLAFANDIVHRVNADMVIVNYVWLSPLLKELAIAPRALRVILAHDLFCRRVGGNSEDFTLSECEESQLLSCADIVAAIQSEEASEIARMLPDRTVLAMPMPATVHVPTANQHSHRVLFVGSASNANVAGISWFLQEVWPIVTRELPDAELHICGTVGASLHTTAIPSNARILGRVEDLAREYGEASVCIVPLRVGSGLKIKVVEALSYGRACVSTRVGLQGLGESVKSAVIQADRADSFAAATIELLGNDGLRRNAEKMAHEYVRLHHQPEACFGPLIELVERIRSTDSNRLTVAGRK